MARGPPPRSLAPAHVRSGLACARYVNRRLPCHRTQTSLQQTKWRVSSLLMRTPRMVPRITASPSSSVHLASSSLKLKSLFGITPVPFAQLCCVLIARYATLSSMTSRHFRTTWKVLSRSRVSSVWLGAARMRCCRIICSIIRRAAGAASPLLVILPSAR